MPDTQPAAAVQSDAHRIIETLMGQVRAVSAIVVSTEDGFEVAALVRNAAQVSALSAMAGSISALSAVAGEENELGECASVVIQAELGCIVMMQARRADVSLILSIVARHDAVLGQLLYACRAAVRALEAA